VQDARRALIGGAIAGIVGLAIGILLDLSASNTSDPDVFFLVVFPLLLAAIGFAIVAVVEGGRPYHLQQWVPLFPQDILHHAARWFPSGRWTLVGSSPGMVSFTRRKEPEIGLVLVLFLIGVVPALLYLLLGGRTQSLTVLTEPAPDGTDLEIIVSSKDGGGRPAANRFFNSLHDLVDAPLRPDLAPAPTAGRRPVR
jgi:hypothetical protein